MLKNKMFGSLLVAVVCLCLSMPAQAATVNLTVDGGWKYFGFYGVGKPWQYDYSFTLLKPGILTVTDAWNVGDIFEVFNKGVSLGLTPEPLGNWVDNAREDFDLAASDPRWSTGIWTLAPGDYLISGNTFKLGNVGVNGGSAALRVDTAPVPVPAAAWLLGSAFVGVLGLRRARKN